MDGGGKLWTSQPGGNRTGSCAGTRGWVGTQHQLEVTISAHHTEQWLPNTGMWSAGAKIGEKVLKGLSVSYQVAKPTTVCLPYPLSPLTHRLATGSFSLSENSHRKLRSFFCCVGSRENGHFSYFQRKSFFLLDKDPKHLRSWRKNKAGDRWTPLVGTRDDQWLLSGGGRLSQ